MKMDAVARPSMMWSLRCAQRVVPVRLTTFSITEEAFDPALNPIQAKVDLGMRVLTYMELKDDTIGFGAYIAYQTQKEVLARLVRVGEAAGAIKGLLPL